MLQTPLCTPVFEAVVSNPPPVQGNSKSVYLLKATQVK